MKNNLTSVQRSRVRSLRDSVRQAKNKVQGLQEIYSREMNPEKAAIIMDDIQKTCGVIDSMENQIERYENGGRSSK